MELLKIVVGAASATAVFVLGQIALKFVIEPIQEQRKTIGRIIDDLIFYANVYLNPDVSSEETRREAHERLRRRSSELHAITETIPLYDRWAQRGWVLPKQRIEEACGELRGVVNASDPDGRDRHLRLVEKALGLRRLT